MVAHARLRGCLACPTAPAAVATQARSSLKEPRMSKSSKSKTAPADPQKDAGGGKTKVEQGGESAPRLPHEHDQSSDSQQTPDGRPTGGGPPGP